MGSNLSNIGWWAFLECDIRSLVLPDSVMNIGANAFGQNFNLASLQLSNNLTVISTYAFSTCKITSVVIPASVEKIEYNAFAYCSDLKNVTIKRSSSSGVYDCNGFDVYCLENIYLPDIVSVNAYKAHASWGFFEMEYGIVIQVKT